MADNQKAKALHLSVEEAKTQKEKITTNRSYKFLLLFFVGLLLILGLIQTIIQRSPYAFLFFFVLLIFGLGMFAWIYNDYERIEELDKIINRGKKVPEDAKIYWNKPYDTIRILFASAGFTNVECVPLNDLKKQNSKKENKVSSISIGDDSIIACDERYDADVTVVISYHSFG